MKTIMRFTIQEAIEAIRRDYHIDDDTIIEIEYHQLEYPQSSYRPPVDLNGKNYIANCNTHKPSQL
jgi:hypothetical protein